MQYNASDVASHLAQYQMYRQLIQQSTLFAYMDAFRIFGALCLCVIPLVFLCKTKSHKKG